VWDPGARCGGTVNKHESRGQSPLTAADGRNMRISLGSEFRDRSVFLATISPGTTWPQQAAVLCCSLQALGLGVGGTTSPGPGGAGGVTTPGVAAGTGAEGVGVDGTGFGGTGGTASDGVGVELVVPGGAW
jgi:hypothetical protein